VRAVDDLRTPEHNLACTLAIHKHDEGMTCARQRRPPAEPGRVARSKAGVMESPGYGLCDGPIVMRQFIGPDVEPRQDFGHCAVDDAHPERVGDVDGDERQWVAASSEVARPEACAAERCECLTQRVHCGTREIPYRRFVVEVEPSDRLPRLQEGRGERLTLRARRVPWETAPGGSPLLRRIARAQANTPVRMA
jgi:hypothetical protein